MTTIRKQATEIQTDDIIHAYGARFRVIETTRYTVDGEIVQANQGRWLDGRTQVGYFGPGKDFNFQGNHRATYAVEV